VGHINGLSQDIAARIQEANQRIASVRDMSNHLARLAERFSGQSESGQALQA